MDLDRNQLEPYSYKSFSSQSSVGSSLRHSLSRSLHPQIDDDVYSENVSEAGDTGDLSLRRKYGIGRSSYSSVGDGIEQAAASSGQEQDVLQSTLWTHDPGFLNSTSVITPLPEDITSPLPTMSLLSPVANNEEKKEEWVLPKSLEFISSLIHLAVFGILGVITRYLLQKLFGPSGAGVTRDGSILYLDLPSNVVGSFLMGWFGVVFKADIASVSEFWAIGLSTGYLGCLTTFSGWNQKMLDLSASGQWVYALFGFLVGLFLTAYSIIFGVETAKGFRWILQRRQKRDSCLKVNTFSRHIVSLILMFMLLVALLSTSALLLSKEFNKGTSEAQLWLGCLVAAPGVWLRWFLARLNGRGLGTDGQNFKWIPFGTLIANVAAACVMASLATLKKSVNTRTCNTVASSIQLGLLGSLSTVSTMMAEFNAMRESDYPWRAYVYASFTIAVSFALGTLIYSVPVWVVGFS